MTRSSKARTKCKWPWHYPKSTRCGSNSFLWSSTASCCCWSNVLSCRPTRCRCVCIPMASRTWRWMWCGRRDARPHPRQRGKQHEADHGGVSRGRDDVAGARWRRHGGYSDPHSTLQRTAAGGCATGHFCHAEGQKCADGVAGGAGPWPSVAAADRGRASPQLGRNRRPGKDRPQLRKPHGQLDDLGSGHSGGDPRRNLARGSGALRFGHRHAAVLAGAAPACCRCRRKGSCGQSPACCADLTGFFLSLFWGCRPMLEKRSGVVVMRKLLILNDSSLRTWPFARPQGVEKERGKTGVKDAKRALRWVAKSASRSEKPRQTRGLTGFIDMQRECLCKL